MTEPRRVGLPLGSDWRVLTDPVRDTVIALHESGLWTEVDLTSWDGLDPDGDEEAAISDSLERVTGRTTGRVLIQVDRGQASMTVHIIPVAQ